MEKYVPDVISRIRAEIPGKVDVCYLQYPYDKYGDPFIRKRLNRLGIREYQMLYQECYEAAMLGYMYSISRCALGGYPYIERYIRKMVRIAITWGINISDEAGILCRQNGFQRIYLDEETQMNRW